MPEIMHTAKILAHGKIPFSGSVFEFVALLALKNNLAYMLY